MIKIFEQIREYIPAGGLVAVGCSTSAVMGERIGGAKGSQGSFNYADKLWEALNAVFLQHGINVAVQCCEHLNRAMVIAKAASDNYRQVCAVPTPYAGGALASKAFAELFDSVLVEGVQADAGIDIGGVMIGMQIRPVAVPIHFSDRPTIGSASITAAYSRPPLIGGERAIYKLD